MGLKIVEAVHQESQIKDLEEPQVLSLRLAADVVEAVKENQSPVHPQSPVVEEGWLNVLGVRPQLGLDLNHQNRHPLQGPHQGQGPRDRRKVKMRLCNHQVVVRGEVVEAAGLKGRPDREKSSKILMTNMKLCPKERDNVQTRVEKVHLVRLQNDVT